MMDMVGAKRIGDVRNVARPADHILLFSWLVMPHNGLDY
jgi:hypothetical protein